ncbi:MULTISPECIES: PAAR domain-containing protein [Caballeronia]|uniref:PAAR domain-containing protein n=1 Tax=Caballeronia TaxID=1827195 RepID=UPI000318D3F2|nr:MULTISPECIES: PAAR domain-containing protein [unclassified Caballeronia]MCE4542199.1 PAAR domain-containing protein [Caballeronia sp. PC1]MCE4568754.1 PAAR domain-containing protein [Caballeronia sp. CLC5]BAO86029.1 putative uncharacterized protein [Burkholderia sp. RPE67]
MNRPICLGDETTHGGKVKTASGGFELEPGRPIALLHDIVTCREHGDNPIIECRDGYDEDGRKWVLDGCKTQCGSVVRASTEGMDVE